MDGRLKLGGDTALKTITGAPLQPWGARGATGFPRGVRAKSSSKVKGVVVWYRI